MKRLRDGNTKIYFCEGNHDDLDALDQFDGREVYPNVFYQKRGSVLTLPDGRTVLFMGGALSIDRSERTLGKDWFKQEIVTEKDVARIPKSNFDIVISHTCPIRFDINHYYNSSIICEDPSRLALDKLFEISKPEQWFFGHWHRKMSGEIDNCKWLALSDSRNRSDWWVWL